VLLDFVRQRTRLQSYLYSDWLSAKVTNKNWQEASQLGLGLILSWGLNLAQRLQRKRRQRAVQLLDAVDDTMDIEALGSGEGMVNSVGLVRGSAGRRGAHAAKYEPSQRRHQSQPAKLSRGLNNLAKKS
jgi:hypothetical protein